MAKWLDLASILKVAIILKRATLNFAHISPATFHGLVSQPNGVRKPQSSRRNFGCSKPQKRAEKAWSYFERPEAVKNTGGEYTRVDCNSSDTVFSPSKTGMAMAVPAVPLPPALSDLGRQRPGGSMLFIFAEPCLVLSP